MTTALTIFFLTFLTLWTTGRYNFIILINIFRIKMPMSQNALDNIFITMYLINLQKQISNNRV